MGASSAERVWDGPNPAGGRRGHCGTLIRPQVCIECSRKPVKQHICCFYWLTRGGEVAAVGLAGAEFWYTKSSRAAGVRFYHTNFVGRAGSDFIYTNFSGGVG